MNLRKPLKIGLMIAVGLLLLGCSRQARKKRYFESAKKYESAGKLAEATIQYKNALRMDPNFAEGHLALAKLVLRQGDIVGSASELRKVLALAPKNLDALVTMGRLYLLAGQADQAKRQAEAALAVHPGDKEASLVLGQALVLSKKTGEAAKVFQDILNHDSKNVQALMGLSSCRLREGNIQSGEKLMRDAVEASGHASNVMLALAGFLEQHNRPQEAQKIYEEAQQRDPKNLAVLVPLAAYYMRSRQLNLAEATLVRVRDLAPANSTQRALLADFYFGSGNKDKAFAELHSLIQKDGPDGRLGEKLGNLLLDEKKLPEAESLIQQIAAKNSKSALARYLTGRVKLAKGDSLGATQEFQEAARYLPKAPAVHFYLGLTYLGQGKREEARSSFNQALQLDPNYGPPRLERARLDLATNNHQAALKDAEYLVRIWPVTKVWMLLVDALRQNGETARARKLLDALISGSPQGPVRALLRSQGAFLDLSEGKFAEARGQLAQAHSDEPKSSLPDEMIAESYIMQNQLGEAERTLTRASAEYPKSRNLQLQLAGVYAKEGKLAEAEALFNQVLKAYPREDAARMGLAQLALAKKDWVSGATQFENLGRERKSAPLLVAAAQAREKAGQQDLARQDYEQALAWDPKNPLALNNLSWIYLNTGRNVDLALSYAQQSKEQMPKSPEASDTLAWAYYQKRRYEFAIDLLQEAIKAKPDSAVYYYHLGKCYLAMRKQTLAKKALEQALQARGDFPREDTLHELQNLGSHP